MPLYTYWCPKCDMAEDRFLPLARYDEVQECAQCGTPMTKVFTPVRVRGDYGGYACPITGAWVEGRKAHRENLAKHGCRVLETGEKEAMFRRKAESEKALDTLAERAAIDQINSMPERKFQTLAAELEKGGDAILSRVTPT